ncbi:transposase-like zinc-binding domain-containing protein [Leminorella richardii]
MHGKNRSGLQRYRCESCKKTFQNKYIYRAYLR